MFRLTAPTGEVGPLVLCCFLCFVAPRVTAFPTGSCGGDTRQQEGLLIAFTIALAHLGESSA